MQSINHDLFLLTIECPLSHCYVSLCNKREEEEEEVAEAEAEAEEKVIPDLKKIVSHAERSVVFLRWEGRFSAGTFAINTPMNLPTLFQG